MTCHVCRRGHSNQRARGTRLMGRSRWAFTKKLLLSKRKPVFVTSADANAKYVARYLPYGPCST